MTAPEGSCRECPKLRGAVAKRCLQVTDDAIPADRLEAAPGTDSVLAFPLGQCSDQVRYGPLVADRSEQQGALPADLGIGVGEEADQGLDQLGVLIANDLLCSAVTRPGVLVVCDQHCAGCPMPRLGPLAG